MKFSKTLRSLLPLISLLALVGCRGLPEAYQGVFFDKAKGVRLTLGSSSAVIEFRGGKKIEEDGQEISYENLVQGIGGLYVKPAGDDGGITDVYYVRPQKGTKRTEGGLVWYQAELIYTQMDTSRVAPVRELKIVQCSGGNVTVDTVAKRWQIGCPASPSNLTLKRVAEREVFNPFGGL